MENGTKMFTDFEARALHIAWDVSSIAVVCIFCFGVPANIFVLFRLAKLMKKNREKFRNGAGLGLFAMTTNDIISMLAMLLNINSDYYIPLFADITTLVGLDSWTRYVCRIVIFVACTLTSASTWIWLVLSTMRYLAIRHPLLHLRAWRAPYRTIALVYFLSAVMNSWRLRMYFLVQKPSLNTTMCMWDKVVVNGINVNFWLELIERIWAYWLPLAIMLYMDATVFLCRPRRRMSKNLKSERDQLTLTEGTSIQTENRKENRNLWRWLLIALIDVLLNAPENVNRLIILLGTPGALPSVYYYYFLMIAKVSFFSQYAFNALYLSLFVFDKSIRFDSLQPAVQSFPLIEKRPSSARKCSNMERQREEQLQSQKIIEG